MIRFLRQADGHFWKSVVDTSGICKILPFAEISKPQKEIAADPPPFKAITANEMMKKTPVFFRRLLEDGGEKNF